MSNKIEVPISILCFYLKFCAFVPQNSFEEIRLNEADVGDKTKWLKEGMDCNLLFWKGKVFFNFLFLLDSASS